MSPEYRNINAVPAEFRQQLRDQVGAEYQRIIQTGAIAYKLHGYKVIDLLLGDAISKEIKASAKKQNSPWYLVKPLFDTEKRHTKEICHPEQEGTKGDYSNHCRGKHRSVTKGPGIKAFFRRPFLSRNKR